MTAAHRVLKDTFGFDDFRPGQEAAIEALLAGRHVLTVMPTGSGKSLCFQVPALALGGLTVVVSPLVALMQDQVAALRLAGVAADSINSANPRAENVAAWRRAASGDTRLLYMAPERLMTERMLEALGRLPVRLFAVDEAHCISQWGPSFRPEYEDLCRLRHLFPGVPIAALTATADAITREDIAERLFGGDVRPFVLGFDRPNIKLSVEMKHEWKRQCGSFVARHAGESGIVYCLSRKKTEETAALLAADGVRALPYHAGMEKEDREAHQNVFMTDPGVVMVATIAFGMGIDKADVRYVLHTDLPGNVEAYYQEIGRAGRDGRAAEAHMLYGLADIRMRRQFIEDEDAGAERRRREHKRLDALLGYCEAPACRRMTLAGVFRGADRALRQLRRLPRPGRARRRHRGCAKNPCRGLSHRRTVRRGPCDRCSARDLDGEGRTRRPPPACSTFGMGADRDKERVALPDPPDGGHRVAPARHRRLRRHLHHRQGPRSAAGRERVPVPPGDRAPTRPSKPAREAGGRRGKELEDGSLSGAEAALLDALKALRLRLAKERGVPAYIVFSDRTLIDMARRRPRTEEEFAEVNGVGAAKLKTFAAPFLAAIESALADAG